MSATGIVFLALSVVMLGLGFYGASVDVVSATGLAESIGQMKNFYFLLGGLILFIVLYRLAFGKASLRVQHAIGIALVASRQPATGRAGRSSPTGGGGQGGMKRWRGVRG